MANKGNDGIDNIYPVKVFFNFIRIVVIIFIVL